MDNVYESSDIITVYTFNNDSVQEIERQEFDVVERTKLTVGGEDWYQLRHLRNGLIELRKPATDAPICMGSKKRYTFNTKCRLLCDRQ